MINLSKYWESAAMELDLITFLIVCPLVFFGRPR